jgi:DNA-binding transcriptional ArsR family regulator
MMQDKNSDKELDSDLSVKAEEYLEVITTEDERIKIIGEELANDTGRAIFGKVSQGIASPNDLAKALNISLPLINWHINRLLSVGLVKVEKTELSSKNKQVKYYGPVKTALVIIPPEEPVSNGIKSKGSKETVLLRLRQYLASIAAFVVGAPAIYAIQRSLNPVTIPAETSLQADVPSLMMKSTESLEQAESAERSLGFGGGTVPEPSSVASEPTMIMIALLGAATITIAVFFITRFYIRKKQNLISKLKKIILK